ncbi:hypothetical protein [Ammoniphilus sp. 3BR4]|uniref:hypothetical protein n=1 Tax=Ammoniphilus sp. 3BR4 TaxID=3158265 RepID=UPI003465B133
MERQGQKSKGWEHFHCGEIDAVVYSESFFLGYAEQGYPLVAIPYYQLLEIHTYPERMDVIMWAPNKNGKRLISINGETNQMIRLASKIQFLLRKRKKECEV